MKIKDISAEKRQTRLNSIEPQPKKVVVVVVVLVDFIVVFVIYVKTRN